MFEDYIDIVLWRHWLGIESSENLLSKYCQFCVYIFSPDSIVCIIYSFVYNLLSVIPILILHNPIYVVCNICNGIISVIMYLLWQF